MALTITENYKAILPSGAALLSSSYNAVIPFVLPEAVGEHYVFYAPITDTVLPIGQITTIGRVQIINQAFQIPPDFAMLPDIVFPNGDLRTLIPFVTSDVIGGTAYWGYKFVFYMVDGTYSVATAEGLNDSDHLGPVTLTGTDFMKIFLDSGDILPTSVDHIDIYRTTTGGNPSTLGKIGTVTPASNLIDPNIFLDGGLPGDGTTAPASPADNLLLIGEASGTYPFALRGGELATFRWNTADFADIHIKANSRIIPLEVMILDD